MTKNFIPRNDEAFDTFYRNLVDYVIDNAARWGHIKQADVNALELQLDDWTVVFDKTRVPHIPQLTAEKNRVRLACERALRHFINRFLRFEPVTDFDRDKMGIPNRDLVRTPHIDVTEVVEFELKLRNIREVLVNFWIKGQTHKAKCQKAFGFLARSLRYAQTPPINVWSFAYGKTPKLSGYAG
jgi:hypothetical protein